MRIGLDGSFLQSENMHTGMGVYTRGLANALASLDEHEVTLLGYGDRPEAAGQLHWHRLLRWPAGKASSWLSHQTLLARTARRLRLNVLHVTGINVRLSRPGVPFWAACPLVVTMHDAIPLTYYGRYGPPLPWRLRLGFRLGLTATRRADAVVTVSQAAREELLRHLRLPPERVFAVLNGLDPCWHDQSATGPGIQRLDIQPPYLLYAGSFEQRKNLLGTVEAYRRALQERDLPPLVLVVERESGHRAGVMAAVEASGIADRLRFVHSLPDEDLVALYDGASLFVYPSFYEGFGFPPLQALARGVPVVSSRTGSLPEVLGDAACYVDPRSPAEIARAMLQILGNHSLASRLSARGREQASRYTWQAAAQKTLAVYERVAEARPA